MKKIAFLWVMIFIISPKVFTDENHVEINNHCFLWQLYYYYNRDNKNIFLFRYPFVGNGIGNDINNYNFNPIDTYLVDSKDTLFLNKIFMFNEYLGNFILFQLQLLEFIDNFSGGPERRRREEIENNRRYNILHPTEPPRKTF
jgi:hypothetical protein